MYRIPLDLNIIGLVNSEINLISLGLYDVHFHFDSGQVIHCYGKVEILKNGKIVSEWSPESHWTNMNFKFLLGKSVASYSVASDILLSVKIAEFHELLIYDNSDQFETIQIGNGSIII